MTNPTHRSDRKRLAIVAFFLLGFQGLLIIQFYKIQILEGDKWTQSARAQHQSILIESFRRGSFLSNTTIKKGHLEEIQPLVNDVLKFHLFIDPEGIDVRCKEDMSSKLQALLPASGELEEKIQKEFYKKSRSRKIYSWLESQQKEKIEAWWKKYYREKKIPSNALYFQKDYQRSYPFGLLFGQVLQTIQEQKDPHTLQAIPIGGVELFFHQYLSGKKGKRLVFRSPRNPLDSGKIITPAEDGADIYLTINHYVQAIAESELKKGVEKANAKGGWALMMDPHNGEILAYAQYPFFDPVCYKKFFNDPDLIEHTKAKAITESTEPASIFKIITAIIGFQANEELLRRGKAPLFSPNEKIGTLNGFFPGRVTPLKDGRKHKFLNLDLAMQKSSNIYFGNLVQRIIEQLGEKWYREKLMALGFGNKTGVEIPAESAGQVPDIGKLHPNGKLQWSLSTPYSLAIGHNILVNGVQMVKAVSLVANKGRMVSPTIWKKIVKNKTLVAENSKSRLPGYKILDEGAASRILESLKSVTVWGGTSRLANLKGYTQAGKSATSEKIIDGRYSKKHYISSFIGIAPTKNPRFVLLISLDEPEVKWIPGYGKNYHGGVCAAPIFREIAQRTLEYLGEAPDDSGKEIEKVSLELRKIYNQWNQ